MSDSDSKTATDSDDQEFEAPNPEAKRTEPAHDWKAEYVREVAQSRKYRQRAQHAETQLQELRRQALSEEEHAEYQRLCKTAEGLADKDQRIKALDGMLRRVAGLNELGQALTACGVGSACPHGEKMLSQAAALLADRIDVDLSGLSPVARVLDEGGEPIVGDDGRPLSIHQFVSHWLVEEGSHVLPASADTGSGAYRGLAVPTGETIEQLDRDPKAKAEFIAKYGPQAYVQLARKQR